MPPASFEVSEATRLVSDPPRIDYGYYPALDNRHFGLIHDHAYWLDVMIRSD